MMALMSVMLINLIFLSLQFLLMKLLCSVRLKENVFLMNMSGSMLLKETMEELSHGVKILMDHLNLLECQHHVQELNAKISICSCQPRLELTAQLEMPNLG
jgi:hypothetical protein